MNSQAPVLETIDGGVATLTLNRPEVKNAMNGEMIQALIDAFHRLAQSTEVRSIVLAANGDAFCSGADLGYMLELAQQQQANQHGSVALSTLFRGIAQCPKPVIARVHGLCFAGAMGLACAADILVASNNATFSLPEVRTGLIAATISPFVVQAMGVRAARRYFLTGEVFTAEQAYRMGMAHDLCQLADLDEVIGGVLDALSRCAPGAVAESKLLVREVAMANISDDELHAQLAQQLVRVRGGAEAIEGMTAFLEKRKPAWWV